MKRQRLNRKVRWGWHVTNEECRLGYDDGRYVREGEKLTALWQGKTVTDRLPRICEFGMHASPYPDQALKQFMSRSRSQNNQPYWIWIVRVEGNLDYASTLGATREIHKFCGFDRTAVRRFRLTDLFINSARESSEAGITIRQYWDKMIRNAQSRRRR